MAQPREKLVEAWRALLKAHRAALGDIERKLKEAGLPPLAWYDALLELRRASGGLRLGELERRMLLEQYNVSRLCDRLQAAGLVERRPDPEDARGRIVAITAAGRAQAKRMWRVYGSAIEEAVGGRLSEKEAEQLTRLLWKLASGASSADPRRE